MKYSFINKHIYIFILLCSFFSMAEEDSWIVEDIRISGLQRVSAGSIFSEIPITIGDEINSEDLIEVSKSIFATGQFDDIQLGRDKSALLINLKERPTIDEIIKL